MNEAVKAQWLEALRSGEYKQAKSQLVLVGDDGSESYCCLGVLCDLAVKTGLPVEVSDGILDNSKAFDGEACTLPVSVTQWAKVKNDNPGLSTDGLTLPMEDEYDEDCPRPGFISLAERNDQGYTFAQIADVIEERL